MKKAAIILILLFVIVAAVFVMKMKQQNTMPAATDMSSDMQAMPAMDGPQPGEPGAAPPQTAPGQHQIIMIKNSSFSPATLTVATGATISWDQEDSMAHTVVSDDGLFTSATLTKGNLFSYTFTKPGTYTYHCSIHPSMKGTIIVQ